MLQVLAMLCLFTMTTFNYNNIFIHAISHENDEKIIKTLTDKTTYIVEKIDESKKECFSPIHLGFTITENFNIQNDSTIAMLDYDKLEFPLILRKWKKGDFFFPLGMKGKKKLSDFFIDKKTPIPEKEQMWVLCSTAEIIWIIGMRISERFKISEKTKKAYIVQLFENKNVGNKI